MKALFLLLCLAFAFCGGFERDLTVSVDPGKTDCFYQQATEGQTIDIEYQVIDGGQGALDVGFLLTAPGGRVLAAQGRRQAGAHRGPAPHTGDYRFCFDNTHSAFNRKTVYFDLIIDSDSEEDDGNDDSDEDVNFPAGDGENIPRDGRKITAETADIPAAKESLPLIDGNADSEDKRYLVDTEDLEMLELLGQGWHRRVGEAAARVRRTLGGARRLQEAVAASAARDAHAAQRSLGRVTLYAACQTAVMLLVGLLQVVMVRSLFDERSRIHNILKKIPLGRS